MQKPHRYLSEEQSHEESKSINPLAAFCPQSRTTIGFNIKTQGQQTRDTVGATTGCSAGANCRALDRKRRKSAEGQGSTSRCSEKPAKMRSNTAGKTMERDDKESDGRDAGFSTPQTERGAAGVQVSFDSLLLGLRRQKSGAVA